MKYYNIPICEAYNQLILEEVSNKILLLSKKYWANIPEDQVKPVLDNFLTNIRVKLQPPQNDINFWFKKSFSEFKDFIENYKSKTEKKTEQKYNLDTTKDGGGKKIAENEEYELWQVDSYEAAKELGRFYKGYSTNWCISTSNKERWITYYYIQNKRIYFLIRIQKQNNEYDKIAILIDINNKLEFLNKNNKNFYNIEDILNFQYFKPFIKYYKVLESETEKHLNNIVKKPYTDLEDGEFDRCSDELKLKYINKIMKYNMFLTDHQFDSYSDKLKLKYLNALINYEEGASDHQKQWYKDYLSKSKI